MKNCSIYHYLFTYTYYIHLLTTLQVNSTCTVSDTCVETCKSLLGEDLAYFLLSQLLWRSVMTVVAIAALGCCYVQNTHADG